MCNQPRKLEAAVCLETPPDHFGSEENRDFRSHFQKRVKETENVHFFSSLPVLLCYKKTMLQKGQPESCPSKADT